MVGNMIYVCGGLREGKSGKGATDEVWLASAGPEGDGAVKSWESAAKLPAPVYGHGSAVCGTRVYVVGGLTGGDFQHQVLVGELEGSTIKAWKPVIPLPTAVVYASVVATDRYLVVIGGQSPGEGKSLIMPTVYVGPVFQDGSISTWYLASSKLPGAWLGFGRSQTSACYHNGMLFCFGGQDALWFLIDAVASASFDPNRGEVGAWGLKAGPPGIPQVTNAVIWKENVFLVGGMVGGKVSGKVFRGAFATEENQ
jgi:hypothetical protein